MKFIELLNTVDKNWSIREKAKSIYRSLGKIVHYDERFAYSKNKELLNKIYYKDIDIDSQEDVYVVCRTINLIYHALLEKLNIKSQIIRKKSIVNRPIDVEDCALIFFDEEGNKIYTNLIGDIENCKYGMKTEYFGITRTEYEDAQDVTFISDKENKDIDTKIGAFKIDYSNAFFDALAKEIKSPNIFKKFLETQGIDTSTLDRYDIMKLKMYYITRFVKYTNKTAGSDERKKFYKRLFFTIFDKKERKMFNAYEFIKEDGEDIEILSLIELNLGDELIYYIYSIEDETYIEISLCEVREKIFQYRERKGKKLIFQNKVKESI